MNGFAANGIGRSSAGASHRARAAVPLLLSLAIPAMAAWEDVPTAPAAIIASPVADQRMTTAQLEVSSVILPRLDGIDGANQANRVALTWLGPTTPNLGLAMGMSLGMTSRTTPAYAVGGSNLRSQVDLGFHWRYTLDRQYRIDFTAWHRVAPADAIDLVQSREPLYGARVEMRLGSTPKSGFVAERGFVGLQLDGGARITLRRSGGKPMVYYRTNF